MSYIRVSGEPSVWTHSHHLARDWQRYSLSSILNRFGSPTQVLVSYEYAGCGDTFAPGVVYDDLGILVQYDGIVQREAGLVKVCPRLDDVTGVGPFLAGPASGIKLEEQMRGCPYVCQPIALEDAAGVSPDSFYQIYADPGAATCLELPELENPTCP